LVKNDTQQEALQQHINIPDEELCVVRKTVDEKDLKKIRC